jgi:hypothetical protein
MNSTPVKVRFTNESTWTEMVNFDWGGFKMDKEYDDEIFGWYLGTYIAIVKK